MALRVALTAAALRTSGGEDPALLWKRLQEGESLLAPLEGFDASGFGALLGAQIWTDEESPEDDPTMRILGPHGALLESVARAVYEGDHLEQLAPERLGLFVGMGMVDSPVHDLRAAALAARDDTGAFSLERFFAGAYRNIHPLWPLSMLGNVAAGQVSIDLDIRGDNVVLASEADASLRALLEAARSIARGDCDGAIAGGVSGRITPARLAREALRGTGGAPLGEGGAAVALRRQAETPLAWVLGGATTHGPREGASGASTDTWTRAVQGALAEAQLAAEDIDTVFLHGDGEPGEAHGESGLLTTGFLRPTHVRATKPLLGHLGAGAPAVDLVLALEALRGGARRVLVLAGSPAGGAGALIVEAA
jgi:3-oxoacyl-(acyl-carrier-protein) synthase